MGMSTMQSSSLDLTKPSATRRNPQENQQTERLECPRCSSTNTKFCYYNNYNKSQPRHFCKACKRHWTKGGTLRNVPVGGCRKNKRHKPANTPPAATSIPSITIPTPSNQQHGQKTISDALFHALIHPSSSLQSDGINISSSKTSIFSSLTFSTPILPVSSHDQNPLFSSTIGCLNTNPSSITTSNRSSDAYAYTQRPDSSLEPTVTTIMPTSSSILSQQWQNPSTSDAMDLQSYWNWNDINSLASADLEIPWDDSEIKF